MHKMEKDSFKTISKPGTAVIREKGSRFLAFSYHVSNEEQIRDKLEFLRKKYHDARHHCYAWRLGADKMNFRANDDGEPSSSAGKPILGQIDAKNLGNTLVVVVRYFGGTLLGVGGLIHAYRDSAREAIAAGTIIDQYIYRIYKLSFAYEKMNVVMKVLKDLDAPQYDQKFEMSCSLKVKIKRSQDSAFLKSFEAEQEIIPEYLGEN